jgi:hypothetical protein
VGRLRAEITLGLVAAFVAVGARGSAETVAVVSRPPPAVATASASNGERPLVGTPMSWPKTGPARVVWTGFQMSGEGGSRVYLQTTNDVEVSVQASKDGLTVTVHNCRIHVRNGGRPLDTRFFSTPVKSVSLTQRKKDVALLIGLKEPLEATPRKEPGPNGSQFWVLDFPSAKSVLADGPASAAARP